MGVKLVLSP